MLNIGSQQRVADDKTLSVSVGGNVYNSVWYFDSVKIYQIKFLLTVLLEYI